MASIVVLAHHCLFAALPQHVNWPARVNFFRGVFEWGYLGVDLFFVLSGYLITSLLLLARRAPNYYHNFYWKRVFRILPALLLSLLISHLLGWMPWNSIVVAILFVANLVALWGQPENGPYWSLSIEEQFYLIWPGVIRRSKPRNMTRLLIVLIVLPAILRIISVALHHGRDRYTFVHCDGLAWGALLAMMLYRARIPYRELNGLALWRSAGRWMFWLGFAGLLASIVAARTGHRQFGMVLTTSGPFFAGLLLYLITHRRGVTARILSSPPMRFLGDVSYMVYLLHIYVLLYYDEHVLRWTAHPTEAGYYLRFFVILGVSLLLCAASLYWFERPIGRLRRYVLRPE